MSVGRAVASRGPSSSNTMLALELTAIAPSSADPGDFEAAAAAAEDSFEEGLLGGSFPLPSFSTLSPFSFFSTLSFVTFSAASLVGDAEEVRFLRGDDPSLAVDDGTEVATADLGTLAAREVVPLEPISLDGADGGALESFELVFASGAFFTGSSPVAAAAGLEGAFFGEGATFLPAVAEAAREVLEGDVPSGDAAGFADGFREATLGGVGEDPSASVAAGADGFFFAGALLGDFAAESAGDGDALFGEALLEAGFLAGDPSGAATDGLGEAFAAGFLAACPSGAAEAFGETARFGAMLDDMRAVGGE